LKGGSTMGNNRQDNKETAQKMKVIKRVDREYLINVLFGGKDPFSDPRISIEEIYQRCLNALTIEALLSAN